MASQVPGTRLSSFTVFPNLPVELQLAIWTLAVPDSVPEVCIAWPLNTDYLDGPVQPFVVDTAWPASAHVCRASREAVLGSEHLRLRYSPSAGFAVPFRTFDPVIDTLYWNFEQGRAMRDFLNDLENAPLVSTLCHIAVDLAAMCEPSLLLANISHLIRTSPVSLRTLSVVLPDSSTTHPDGTSFLPPARRCQLRDLPPNAAQETSLSFRSDPWWNNTEILVPLWPYIQDCCRGMDAYLWHSDKRVHVRTAQNPEDISPSSLEIKVQTFVEYVVKDGGEQWVEVCGRRTYGTAR
jgi:hypothetical protein